MSSNLTPSHLAAENAALKARCKVLEEALDFEQGALRDLTRTVLQHNGNPKFLIAVATERREQLHGRANCRAARKALDG